MSRIGKLPITVPPKVEISVNPANEVKVKGPQGELSQRVDRDIAVKVDGNTITIERPTEQKRHKALHGLYRTLIHNMVTGVSQGYTMDLELVGVGYKATSTNNILEFSLGYSHSIFFVLPKEVTATAVTEKGKNPIVTLKSIDKQLIGQIAAKIRGLRKVEPYKGKGIRFVGEVVRRKAGKTSAKK
jgi:large subunit ribosomal protein L6